jgi:hypothetical protein
MNGAATKAARCPDLPVSWVAGTIEATPSVHERAAGRQGGRAAASCVLC